MSAEKLIFAHARDNRLRSATLSLSSGTVQAGYGLTNLAIENWAVPFKIDEVTLDLRVDLGASALPAWVILGNSNLTVAARLQGHSDTATWAGATAVDLTFSVPTASLDGIFSSPHLAPEVACRYWRLTVTGNAYPIIIGELVFAATRRTFDGTYASSGTTIVHATAASVDLAYSVAARRESLSGQVAAYASEEATIRNLLRSTRGVARPFWLVLPLDPADAFMVRAVSDPQYQLIPGGSVLAFPIRELSRGLPWIDPDV